MHRRPCGNPELLGPQEIVGQLVSHNGLHTQILFPTLPEIIGSASTKRQVIELRSLEPWNIQQRRSSQRRDLR